MERCGEIAFKLRILGVTAMRTIVIRLWRHVENEDWSIQINGEFMPHVSAITVDELIEYVVLAAQQELLQQEDKEFEPENWRGDSFMGT
jgi:hypothetical protein